MKNLKSESSNSMKVLSRNEMRALIGGVTREEYCSTLTTIERDCFNRGDQACIANAGAAWEANCK